jgi:hypothetical protein
MPRKAEPKINNNPHNVKYGFLITEDKTAGYGQYFHLNLCVVYITDQGMLDYPGRADLGALGTMKISCQCDRETKHSYAWRLEYGDSVTLENIEAVAAVMKSASRAMQKMEDEDGPAESFGRFAFRAAKALGATFFCNRQPGRDIKEHSYFMPLADGIFTMNQSLHAWVDANYRERGAA